MAVHPRTHDAEGNPCARERARPVLVETASTCSLGAAPPASGIAFPLRCPATLVRTCSGAYEAQPCAAKLVAAVEAVSRAHGAVDYAPEFRLWRAGQNDEHFDETIAARPALADVECAPPTRSNGRANRVPHWSAYVT